MKRAGLIAWCMTTLLAAGVADGAPDDRFLSGPFDGYAQNRLEQFIAQSSVRFLGGSFDGYGRDGFSQYDAASSPQWVSIRFLGGSHDGYSKDLLEQYDAAVSPQKFSPRFIGGSLDGYSRLTLLQYDAATSPQRTGPRFSGGGHDGWSFTAIYGLPNPLNDDMDGDGMPDWWELPYFGGVTNGDPNGDIDGDRMTEIKEWISDTDPTDSNSFFRITNWEETNSFTVTFTSSTNRIYDLQRSESTEIEAWSVVQPFEDLRGDASGILSFTDTNDFLKSRYRVRVSVP
ncbi:MAG: hypothetical protein KJ626_01925 [Verrucomicrobia bacterium]|nr:hypothetical protein [Verrucomicrobiota bacterium]